MKDLVINKNTLDGIADEVNRLTDNDTSISDTEIICNLQAIKKADGSKYGRYDPKLMASESEVNFDLDHTSREIGAFSLGDGEITAELDDVGKEIATLSKSGNILTVNSLKKSGYGGIIVKSAKTNNYRRDEQFIPINSDFSDPNTLLLIHGGSIEDSSKYRVPLTNNGVVVSAGQSKFGEKSLYFNGNTSIDLILNLSEDQLFSIDFWINIEEYFRKYPTLVDFAYNESVQRYYIQCRNTFMDFGQPNVRLQKVLPLSQWIHLALIKTKTELLLFINGKKEGSHAVGNYGINKVRIGGLSSNLADGYIKGYIDELRISNIPRWTSDFTPPTEPYYIN